MLFELLLTFFQIPADGLFFSSILYSDLISNGNNN